MIVLKRGGFDLKGISFSESTPCTISQRMENQSSWEEGGRWLSKSDHLMLNVGDLNSSQKIRRRKAQGQITQISENFTGHDYVSRVFEVFDPLGEVSPTLRNMKINLHDFD